MRRRFTLFVIAGMVLGVLVGFACNQLLPVGQHAEVAGYFSILTTVFLRLIKMIIAPLVFATLVVGVAHMEDAGAVGRVGAKTLGWFICASIVSLTIGLIMVHLLQPGVGLSLPNPNAAGGAAATVSTANFTLSEFVTHIIPTSIIDAMARNEILQIVVFAVFVGTAIAAIDSQAPQVLQLAEQGTAVMLKVTSYVMLFAPVAIFAALAATVTENGLGILLTYAQFVGGFYLSLAVLWLLLIGALLLIVRKRVFSLLSAIREPVILAFSTASSEAAYPRTLEGLQSWGVSRRIASFVLPLGYSFNLDGSMMYCTFAVLFICQAYGIEISLPQQLTMLALLMVTSKGMAGVPRASLVVIAATLTYFRIPEAGLLLILAVDHLLDMGRSATNVVGNTVASAVVAKWEGEIGEPGTAGPADPATREASAPEGDMAGTVGARAPEIG